VSAVEVKKRKIGATCTWEAVSAVEVKKPKNSGRISIIIKKPPRVERKERGTQG